MWYINAQPDATGNYGNPASAGAVKLPEELLASYLDTLGFAVVTVESGAVTAVEVNQAALDAYRAAEPRPTPQQQRENAYNTLAIIAWDGGVITVTAAAQLWQYYAAEGDTETIAELTALIAAAKAQIREQFPDNAESEVI